MTEHFMEESVVLKKSYARSKDSVGYVFHLQISKQSGNGHFLR